MLFQTFEIKRWVKCECSPTWYKQTLLRAEKSACLEERSIDRSLLMENEKCGPCLCPPKRGVSSEVQQNYSKYCQ